MNNSIKEGKNTAIIAHFTLIGAIIAIFMNSEPKNDFARYYTRQAFGLHLTHLGFALFLSQAFNEYAWIGLYVFYLILWGYSFTGVLANKKQEVPLVGAFFQKWFTFIS